MGAPSLYDPKYCQEIIDFMGRGYSLTAFAAKIDVNKDTVYEWAKVHQDFSDALKTARLKCQLFWEEAGMKGMFTPEGIKFSTSFWIFNMKCRFKWVEPVSIDFKDMTKEQCKKFFEDQLAALNDGDKV